MFMPVVLALHDAEPDDRIVYPAKGLAVPAIRARRDQRGTSTNSHRPEVFVQISRVRIVLSGADIVSFTILKPKHH